MLGRFLSWFGFSALYPSHRHHAVYGLVSGPSVEKSDVGSVFFCQKRQLISLVNRGTRRLDLQKYEYLLQYTLVFRRVWF